MDGKAVMLLLSADKTAGFRAFAQSGELPSPAPSSTHLRGQIYHLTQHLLPLLAVGRRIVNASSGCTPSTARG
ncbi:hypothetical protein BVG79_p1000201 (plasmid) [Ketogulonicigenium robustum]|uniref:Uncharacterized protein n=1 Tax=Ketogulonicigenium robustum TaxID=92947 RepID=A0A1W6P3L6_9RHOB|nr:hypothetical protein [Ketogulonicigenium robustum]ARO16003.1 hypothetical protein BVG79_p1000201 [Ketogulonicigenium robustum]